MTENMKKFLEAVSKNKELCEKASKLDKDALTALAKELGIGLTEADFAQAEELNDDDLETVTGGQTCGCALIGGGVANTNAEESCACVAGGGGEISDLAGGGCRCACVAGGYGKPVESVRYPEKTDD